MQLFLPFHFTYLGDVLLVERRGVATEVKGGGAVVATDQVPALSAGVAAVVIVSLA